MLVLTRKQGERIVIPKHEITITVLSISANKIRLGIDAKEDDEVYREEVYARMNDAEAA